MTLRYSSSDNYSNNHNNLSWITTHLIESRKNTKGILSADNCSNRLTVAPISTPAIKIINNKVSRHFLFRFTVDQAQTTAQNIGRQTLHNFSSWFLSILIARCRARFSFIGFWLLCAAKSKRTTSKTRPKKLKTLFQIKNIFQILLFGLFPFFTSAQETKDTKATKKNKCNTGIFISAGINSGQYCSDKYSNYLFSKTFSAINGAPNTPLQPDYTVTDNSIPGNINYNKSSLSPMINLGLELNSKQSKQIKLNHIIFVSYTHLFGNYSYTNNYSERWESNGSPARGWAANIKDTAESKFSQTAISLGYKFQPTFNHFFLSCGINCSLNLMEVDQHHKNYINGTTYDEFNPPTSYSRSSITGTTIKTYFVNFPFQFGSGGNFQIKKIALRPAFYFTPFFMQGYNFYNISLDILYEFTKR